MRRLNQQQFNNTLKHYEREIKEFYPIQTLKWEMFNEKVKYFISLFTTTDNTEEDFKFIENQFLYYLYTLGELFVTKFKNRYQLWRVYEKQYEGIYLDKVKITLIQPHSTNPNIERIAEIPSNQGVYVKWEENVIPAYVRLKPFIDKEYELYQSFDNATILDMKKLIYNINNDSNEITNEELNSLFDPTLPYVKSINPMSRDNPDVKNIFQEVRFSSSTADQQFKNLINHRNYMRDLYSMVRDKETNQERSNMGQTVASNYQNENIETIILKNLQSFAKQMKQKFNVDIEFIETNNLTNIKTDTENEQDFYLKEKTNYETN